jgi:SAM-dependent methyltransferase
MTAELHDTLQLVRRIEAGGPPLAIAIDARDRVFQAVLGHGDKVANAQSHYFAGGERLLQQVRDLLAGLDVVLADAQRLLEVGAGHGRLTRHLARVVDPSRITAADADRQALEFQATQLGVATAPLDAAPADGVLPDRYDLILAPTFLGHVPEALFGPWIGRLYDALADGGTLLFGACGAAGLPVDHAMPESGILHVPAGHPRMPGAPEGVTYVSAQHVADVVRERTGQALALAAERGLFNIQDAYAVRKPAPAHIAGHGGGDHARRDTTHPR